MMLLHARRKLTLTLAPLVALLMSTGALADTLVINSLTSDPAPKEAFVTAVDQFQAENPDIEVRLNVYDHEGFKTALRDFLITDPPDVITWFSGNRMKVFVDRGLFDSVSDIWAEEGLDEKMPSLIPTMTIDNERWGVPYAYYHWGVYYRKDLFEQVGASVPTTWDEFLEAGEKLKAAGITPVTIGTKFLWTTGGWFDYLNMRLNGLDFHLDLTAGKIPYTDDRVRLVFAMWRQLIDEGYFIDDHATLSWQDAQAPLFDGNAAMYLIGNFITPFFSDEIEPNMGFFQFPSINPNIELAEDAPTETLHIPAGAKNKEDARRFLAFMTRPDIQGPLNETIGNLPTNNQAPIPDDRFLEAGSELLGNTRATAQFYDRDTDPEMAKIGMQGFQEFMVDPDQVENILERLEAERQRIFELQG